MEKLFYTGFKDDLRQVLAMAIPATLGSIVDMLQLVADMIMLGKLSLQHISAIGISSQYILVVGLVFSIFSVAASYNISRSIGSGRFNRAHSNLYTLLTLGLVVSLFFILFTYIFANYYFKLLVPNDMFIINIGLNYTHLLVFSFPFLFFNIILFTVFSVNKDSKTPLYIKIFTLFINVILNYIFIFGKFGAPRLEEVGAASTTVFSYVLTTIIYICILVKGKKNIKILPIFNIQILKKGLLVGFYSCIDRLIFMSSFLVFTGLLTRYGTDALVAYQIGGRVENFATIPGFAFAMTTTAFVGNHLGAKNGELAIKFTYLIAGLASLLMGLIGIFMIIFPEALSSIFTDNSEAIFNSSLFLTCIGFVLIPLAYTMVIGSSLEVGGFAKDKLKINLISMWFFRLLPIYIIYLYQFPMIYIFITISTEIVIKSIIYNYLFQKKKQLFLVA